ncbi:MAG TPA: 4-aminobutyrate--2-oxoglutarate transaminase [Rudaea sp.]|jgi:4-aminobutyrate aminotransferase/(S)-3-amino-2-methylpropionate transaminase|uniref:4-aminobutyrate--2-oxoglutarate transaminase n=1 Tax=Rudaea sp. TaxID=2136325 RepID=UPI002F957D23
MTTTNQEWMKRRNAAVANGVKQTHAIFAERADNAELWDIEGRRYIDFAGGIAVLNTGHCHPQVSAAVRAQLERFTHTCFQIVAHDNYVEVAEKLNALAPGDFAKKSVLLTTGAEAVENAVKIARAATKRSAVITFTGGYHGRTLMTLAMTGKVSPFKLGFGPFPGEVFHARFPNALHGVSIEEAKTSLDLIFQNDVEASRVAAIVIEPVQGEGGFYIAPFEFLRYLRELCDKHGILLIADEIQTGAGRTGKWFAIEHSGVVPDLITTAKSLAGGIPLSAVVGRADVMDVPLPGALGGTYAGNPLACAAALAVMRVFKDENLLQRGILLGGHLIEQLRTMQRRHAAIAEVRGLGAMVAFELFTAGGAPDADLARAIVARSLEKGLILLACGIYGNAIRILVPLTASLELVDEGLAIIADCLQELSPAVDKAA